MEVLIRSIAWSAPSVALKLLGFPEKVSQFHSGRLTRKYGKKIISDSHLNRGTSETRIFKEGVSVDTAVVYLTQPIFNLRTYVAQFMY